MALSLSSLPELSLQLLASSWSELNAHRHRQGLLSSIESHLKNRELQSTLQATSLDPLPVALFGFSAVVYQGDVYVHGGRASTDTSTDVQSHLFCFDMAKSAWRTCKQYSTPSPKRWHTCTVTGPDMYTYGGQVWCEDTCSWASCDAIHRYNFPTSIWSVVQQSGSAPANKLKAAAAAGSSLYVVPARQDGSPAFTELHCFDLESCCWNTWACTGPDIPDRQLLLEHLLYHNGQLIAVVSSSPAAAAASAEPQTSEDQPAVNEDHFTVYRLSLGDCCWHCMATNGPQPCRRAQSCIVLLQDLLVVSGGTRRSQDNPLLDDLHYLHLPTKTWHQQQLPSSCHPGRACHAAVALAADSKLLLIGGWHHGWPDAALTICLHREYMCKHNGQQQQQGSACAESGGMQQPSTAQCVRPVVNTELRTALIKSAGISLTTAAAQAIADSTNSVSSSSNRVSCNSGSSAASTPGLKSNMPFSDVTLVSEDGVEYCAHRFILAAQSPVFEAMLSSDMSEAATGTISLPDVSAPVLSALLSYMYGGLPSGISQELVLGLFTAADRLMIPGLAAECVLVLLGCLTAENVSLVADLANTHRVPELWEACVAYVAKQDVQLEVFNSAAYAQLWRDSAAVAQALTTQAVGLNQAMQQPKLQSGAGSQAASGNTKAVALAKCVMPALQETGRGLPDAGHLDKKQRTN